jgi:hypothetical protein
MVRGSGYMAVGLVCWGTEAPSSTRRMGTDKGRWMEMGGGVALGEVDARVAETGWDPRAGAAPTVVKARWLSQLPC